MYKWRIWVVLLLAFCLRFIGLTSHPAGFTPDEASFGYDAYSLLHSGHDQWGKSWPLVLESFGDYKTPLYTYLALPTVALFGLSEFAVRLPNVLLGTLAILVTYLLCVEVFKKKEVGFLAGFLLAISPWHVAMSRGAFEANLTTFLLPLSLYFYFKGRKTPKFLLFAALTAGVNIFSYHSARLVTPMLLGALLLFDLKNLKKDKYFWLAGFISIVVIAATLISFSEGAGARIASSGIFSLTGSDQRYWATFAGSPDFLSRIFFNKFTFLASTFLKNYLSYFSPQFLFTHGAAEGTYGMIPGRGVLYLPELIFLGGFVWYLFKNGAKNIRWLILWILIAPIPASLTIGPGYAANRAVIMLPVLYIAFSLGALSIKSSKLFVGVITTICISFLFFIHAYWYLQPINGASSMLYGAKEVVEYFEANKGGYDELIISKKLSEPHIYVAFYSKMDPAIYQQNSKTWDYQQKGLGWVDQLPSYFLNSYQFKLIDWQFEANRPGRKLLAGTPEEFPSDIVPLKIISYPNGKPAYYIVDTQKLDYAYAH